MKRQVTCFKCEEPHNAKSSYKLPDRKSYICYGCLRCQGSQKTIARVNREVRIARRRTAFNKHEEHVLWSLYGKKGLSYEEKKARMKQLKQMVISNNQIEYIRAQADKPSFTESFRRMKQEYKRK